MLKEVWPQLAVMLMLQSAATSLGLLSAAWLAAGDRRVLGYWEHIARDGAWMWPAVILVVVVLRVLPAARALRELRGAFQYEPRANGEHNWLLAYRLLVDKYSLIAKEMRNGKR